MQNGKKTRIENSVSKFSYKVVLLKVVCDLSLRRNSINATKETNFFNKVCSKAPSKDKF